MQWGITRGEDESARPMRRFVEPGWMTTIAAPTDGSGLLARSSSASRGASSAAVSSSALAASAAAPFLGFFALGAGAEPSSFFFLGGIAYLFCSVALDLIERTASQHSASISICYNMYEKIFKTHAKRNASLYRFLPYRYSQRRCSKHSTCLLGRRPGSCVPLSSSTVAACDMRPSVLFGVCLKQRPTFFQAFPNHMFPSQACRKSALIRASQGRPTKWGVAPRQLRPMARTSRRPLHACWP